MKRTLALFAVALVTVALAADKITPSAILKSPAKFDHKTITVTGVVQRFVARSSDSGKYFLFDLTQGKDKIAVFGRGELKPAPKEGQKVAATGEFEVARKVGDRTYKNELEVTPNGHDKNGVVIVK
ncbi:MAG TPA: cytochrome c maturation protein CcmE [Fimbriimonadaceae bacterium]|nr:cytochrome c maturation protein CcmE [Fimbriimonadaceae bacterium]